MIYLLLKCWDTKLVHALKIKMLLKIFLYLWRPKINIVSTKFVPCFSCSAPWKFITIMFIITLILPMKLNCLSFLPNRGLEGYLNYLDISLWKRYGHEYMYLLHSGSNGEHNPWKKIPKLFHKIPVVLLERKLLVNKILRDEELKINTGLKKGEKNMML